MTSQQKKPQDQASKSAPPSTGAGAGSAKDAARITDLEKLVKDLTEQVKRSTEIASRAQAELQNAKIRMEKDASDLRKFASEMALRKLLPTIDNLQRALKNLPKDIETNEWVKGIVALEQQFLKEVGDLGLKRFDSVGKSVDADRHEVLMAVDGEAGKVIDVIEDGYELHGKILRPAKVKVGSGSQPAAATPPLVSLGE